MIKHLTLTLGLLMAFLMGTHLANAQTVFTTPEGKQVNYTWQCYHLPIEEVAACRNSMTHQQATRTGNIFHCLQSGTKTTCVLDTLITEALRKGTPETCRKAPIETLQKECIHQYNNGTKIFQANACSLLPEGNEKKLCEKMAPSLNQPKNTTTRLSKIVQRTKNPYLCNMLNNNEEHLSCLMAMKEAGLPMHSIPLAARCLNREYTQTYTYVDLQTQEERTIDHATLCAELDPLSFTQFPQ